MFVDSLHSLHINTTKPSDCLLGFSAPEVSILYRPQNAFIQEFSVISALNEDEDKQKKNLSHIQIVYLYTEETLLLPNSGTLS